MANQARSPVGGGEDTTRLRGPSTTPGPRLALIDLADRTEPVHARRITIHRPHQLESRPCHACRTRF
jgi:hypothetical protein